MLVQTNSTLKTNRTNEERKVSMSENQNTVTPPKYNITATRNGIELSSEIIPFKRLKGDAKDTFYPAIDLNLENKDKVFAFLGDGNLINIVRKFLKSTGQQFAALSINSDTGEFDEALFAKYLTELSTAGLKLSEINDLIDELQAVAIQLVDKGELVIDGKLEQAFEIVNGKPTASAALRKLNDDIRSYRQMKEDKQRTPKADVEAVASVAA